MVIRCIIKFYKRRFEWLKKEVPMNKMEAELLEELFTHKNYTPRTDKERFRSFNSVYREWLFQMKPFCEAFKIFYCTFSLLKLFPRLLKTTGDQQSNIPLR